jgi:purine nucleosidase
MALIIDTDIGSDIDDCIAIAHAVRSGIDVKLITTVHGDTQLRARIAKKLTNLLGTDIPIAAGKSMPIKQKHIYTIGTEQHYLIDEEPIDMEGVERLAETIRRYPGIHIAAIGPMTNLACAFREYKDLPAKIGKIYAMGNAVLGEGNYFLNYRSHNFKVDPEATEEIFATNIPKTIVTTPVCKQSHLTRAHVDQFKDGALSYIAENATRWLEHIQYNEFFLYDPLTIHHYIDPRITEKRTFGNVQVTTRLNRNFSEQCMNTLLGGSTWKTHY